MADLLGCSTGCYSVNLPACFDKLVVTLEADTTYDAVFTNQFGNKKIIEVTSEADGSLQIDAGDFVPGYFFPGKPVTLEFFSKSSGGGYSDAENDPSCEADIVCGEKRCFNLNFYDADDQTQTEGDVTATIKCCEETTTPECDCQNFTEVTTVGEWNALKDADKFNYLVCGGIVENDDAGITFIKITNQFDGYESDQLFSDLISGIDTFYFFACTTDLLAESAITSDLTDCGDCTLPQLVETVGDLQELIVDGSQNFVHVIVTIENFGLVDVAFLLTDEQLTAIQGADAATTIEDFFEGELPDGAQFFRFSVCSGLVTGSPSPAITQLTNTDAPACDGENLTFTLLCAFENIPAGSSVRVYALVGALEIVVTNAVVISGNDQHTWTEADLIETLDTGMNHFKVVITLPDFSSVEEQTAGFEVPECEPQPSMEITLAEQGGCLGEDQTINFSLDYANIPDGSSYELSVLVSGVPNVIYSSGIFLESGTDSNAGVSAGQPIDTGTNTLSIVITLPDLSTIEDSLDFEVTTCP